MTEKIADLLNAWQQVPRDVEEIIAGRSDEELAYLPGSEGLSLKELVHHLVEANIVAAGMIIAALGASGATFDWSWLWPNKAWNERLAYNVVPIAPSLRILEDLTTHISNVIAASNGGLEREIRLFDSPGAETYVKTVAEIIKQEVEHASQHLADVQKT